MDLNPVLVHPLGAAVVDARIVIDPATASRQKTNHYEHMAIHPYPVELERSLKLKDGATLLMRAIRPDDAALERAFMASLSQATRYYRFLHPIAELSADMIARFHPLVGFCSILKCKTAVHHRPGQAFGHQRPD